MRAYVAAVVERLQPAPDAGPLVFHQFGLPGGFIVDVGVGVGGAFFGVDPLLNFNRARAVIEPVSVVGGLFGDVADLADEGNLFLAAGGGGGR